MRLTKLTHSCVRIEDGGGVLVIDPGIWTEPDALHDAMAVLITHEHVDHFDPDRLRRRAADPRPVHIWTNQDVGAQLADLGDRVTTVRDGDRFEAAGFEVATAGEWHAVIHPDLPRARNVCFTVADAVFHPGDTFTKPPRAGLTVLVPIQAGWLRIAEAIDFVRDAQPSLAIGIHDAMLNDRGTGLTDRILGNPGILGGARYQRLLPGDSVELG